MTGAWKLTRKIGTRTAENRVHVEWVLNHQFLQIHMIDVKSPPENEALVSIGYDHVGVRYVVYWLDTFGGKFSEKGAGKRDGSSICFEFLYPDGILHNTFTWDPAGHTRHAVIEQQDEQGLWSVFAVDDWTRA